VTADIWIAYAITLAALGLFIWNRLRVDVVGLIVMAALIVTGLVTVREGTSASTHWAGRSRASPARASFGCWSSAWRWSFRSAPS
jgi:di/tricarboxylate transporter